MMAERGIIKARKRQPPPLERSFQYFPCGKKLCKNLFCSKYFFSDFWFGKSELVKVFLVGKQILKVLWRSSYLFRGHLAISPFSPPRDQPSIQKMRRRHHYMKSERRKRKRNSPFHSSSIDFFLLSIHLNAINGMYLTMNKRRMLYITYTTRKFRIIYFWVMPVSLGGLREILPFSKGKFIQGDLPGWIEAL